VSRHLHAAVLALACLALLGPAAAGAADPPRYKPYYDIFDRGDALIPGHDTRWTPQGLAYWPEQDALVISYYDGQHKKRSRLAVIDRATGKGLKIVELPGKGHVGGLGMSDAYLWAADGGRVTRFAKTTLATTADGARLKAAGSYAVRASSYLTIVGRQLWLGEYKKDSGATAYRYTLDKGGVPRDDHKTLATPSQVQGMAIASGRVIWSRSTGRDNDSLLDVRPLSAPTGPGGRSILAPNMSEGIVLARGELHVLYESASATYADADYRVRTVHHGPIGKVLG
jgi:hypothetical protein